MENNERDDRSVSYENQVIVDVPMGRRVQQSFIEYAMSVIVSRALPDVRDGLKPVHRRILYAMYEDKLTYDKPFCKSAATVGNVLGRYHPHGDASVYDAMVRLAQTFSMRYPLIDGHGNFGNVDGDGAAAYRYTEARMSKLANEMLTDLDKNVVDFTPNFDNRLKEPVVLPSRFPNVLVNGSVGIAVGMATNIPPHNLGEVIDGTIYLMDNPDASVADLMQYIKGPDFPTKAMICGTSGIYNAYSTGHGKVIVRARATVDDDHHNIVITEIPYMVNKSMLVESIANLAKDKRVEGITALRDESGKAGMRIVIEFRHDANGEVILNQLYKYTQLQDTCGVNMIALVNGEPKLLGLKEILTHYINFQEEVIKRRTQFDLDKTLTRVHILEGQKIALDNIEEVIKTIRAANSITDARDALVAKFGLTEAQAQAIVDMTLGKLAGLERIKIETELKEKNEYIAYLRGLLEDDSKIREVIKKEMLEIKDKYSDGRRTEIVGAIDNILDEDLIDRHECVLTLTEGGYIKNIPATEYVAQHRGGQGSIGIKTKEEDNVKDMIIAHSHAYLLLFTNLGRVYMKKTYQIPESSRTAKGTNLVNVIDLNEGETVTSIIAIPNFDDEDYFVMVTKRGVIKRANIKDYEYQRKGGKIAINLDEGDELLFVKHTTGNNELIVATRNGKAVRFNENEARVLGRTARGVRAIKLKGDDVVVGTTIVEEGKKLFTLTELGYGKRNNFEGFTAHSRGTCGVNCHSITEKTGKLAGIATVSDDDDALIISDQGTVIRMHIADVPVYTGKATGGVIIMRVKDGEKIVNFTIAKSAEEEEKEIMEAEANDEKKVAHSESETPAPQSFDED